MSGDDPYLYPSSAVLINKFGIRNAKQLDHLERKLVAQRESEGAPGGRFDLKHLRAIHRHLFQDIYDWAGEIRTVEMSKGGNQFQLRQFIETGMADIFRRLRQAQFLKRLSPEDFAAGAGQIMGDINYVHPFREGNGRTQLLYLEQLAEQAGHKIDLTRLDPRRWIAASRAAHMADYGQMAAEIKSCLEPR